MVEEGEVISKTYGKSVVYSIKQDVVKSDETGQTLDSLEAEINKVSDELNAVKGENKKLEGGNYSYRCKLIFILNDRTIKAQERCNYKRSYRTHSKI